MAKNLTKVQRLTVTAVLSALIAVVSFLPLRTLGFEITFSMVPVAVGAILYGPLTGAVLGAVFGTVSFLQCFGYSALGSALLGENFFFALIMCLPTRLLAGLLTGIIFRAFDRSGKIGKKIAFPVASLAAPLLNTVFFMSALVLLFYNTDIIQSFVSQLGAANPFIFIVLFVGVNGIVEMIAGFIVAYPVSKALARYLKLF